MGKKTRKPITSKRPPVPTDTHTEIEEWMTRRVVPDMHPIVELLDRSIRETIPGLRYAMRSNAYYGLPELGWIIEMAAYVVSVNVVFFGGVDFDPPPPLGTTDRSRYVKVRTLEEAQGSEIRNWIEQAARVPGWR
jgi:hypothetical protein